MHVAFISRMWNILVWIFTHVADFSSFNYGILFPCEISKYGQPIPCARGSFLFILDFCTTADPALFLQFWIFLTPADPRWTPCKFLLFFLCASADLVGPCKFLSFANWSQMDPSWGAFDFRLQPSNRPHTPCFLFANRSQIDPSWGALGFRLQPIRWAPCSLLSLC